MKIEGLPVIDVDMKIKNPKAPAAGPREI